MASQEIARLVAVREDVPTAQRRKPYQLPLLRKGPTLAAVTAGAPVSGVG